MTKDRKALSLSAVLWFFLFVVALIIPLPVYKSERTFGTLSIKLEPLPQPVQTASAQKTSDTAKAASRKAATQKTETASSPNRAAAPSAAQAKKTDTKTATRRENVPLQKSMEQLMAEQARSAKEKQTLFGTTAFFHQPKRYAHLPPRLPLKAHLRRLLILQTQKVPMR